MIRDLPADHRPHFEGSLSTAFGCTLEGAIPEAQILRLAEALMAAGCDEVGIADTTGYANPASVKHLIRILRAAVGDEAVKGIHLHNTRGRSEEHTSELQTLMRKSYAVFCLKRKSLYTISQETSTTVIQTTV